MPAQDKQQLINLLIDSPLRDPIKINLIDIVNNTQPENLPKVIPTIQKELEIYQKATQRRLKLAQDIAQKLTQPTQSPPTPPTPPKPQTPNPETPPTPPKPPTPPTPPTPPVPPTPPTPPTPPKPPAPPVPPKPETSSPTPPPPQPANLNPEDPDEQALAEIQKELEALKNSFNEDAGTQNPQPDHPKPEEKPTKSKENSTSSDDLPPTPSI